MSTDPHPFTCRSCGVSLLDHHGMEGTCAELIKTRQELRRLREVIRDAKNVFWDDEDIDAVTAAQMFKTLGKA